jgi:hypothetical protein
VNSLPRDIRELIGTVTADIRVVGERLWTRREVLGEGRRLRFVAPHDLDRWLSTRTVMETAR